METTTPDKVSIVRLTRIESNHNNLRTRSLQGWCFDLPVVGSSFTIMGQPISEGAVARVVTTSPVLSIENLDQSSSALRFRTKNSTYELEVLNEAT